MAPKGVVAVAATEFGIEESPDATELEINWSASLIVFTAPTAQKMLLAKN